MFFKYGKKKGLTVLQEEIRSIIDAGEDEGLIDEQSGEMIQSIFELRDTVAREVMVPRTDIVALSSDATIEDIITLVSEEGHTRMPCYEGNIDNIIGILNVKDLLRFWSKPAAEIDILSILRKAYYIPETKNIHQLLHELRDKKSHIAIVIDEYGGTSGLITLEDLIEEIVGEIHDEHDMDEDDFVELADGDVIVDSRVEIEDFAKYFSIEVPEGQFETLGGLILFLIKRIPLPGDKLSFGELKMVVESADERSIKKVRIRRLSEKPVKTALDDDKKEEPSK